MNSKLEVLWQEHNSKINSVIGKLTVPAMSTFKSDPLLREAHQDLIDFAAWFDEQMEKIN
jgi:hypothetical protein